MAIPPLHTRLASLQQIKNLLGNDSLLAVILHILPNRLHQPNFLFDA